MSVLKEADHGNECFYILCQDNDKRESFEVLIRDQSIFSSFFTLAVKNAEKLKIGPGTVQAGTNGNRLYNNRRPKSVDVSDSSTDRASSRVSHSFVNNTGDGDISAEATLPSMSKLLEAPSDESVPDVVPWDEEEEAAACANSTGSGQTAQTNSVVERSACLSSSLCGVDPCSIACPPSLDKRFSSGSVKGNTKSSKKAWSISIFPVDTASEKEKISKEHIQRKSRDPSQSRRYKKSQRKRRRRHRRRSKDPKQSRGQTEQWGESRNRNVSDKFGTRWDSGAKELPENKEDLGSLIRSVSNEFPLSSYLDFLDDDEDSLLSQCSDFSNRYDDDEDDDISVNSFGYRRRGTDTYEPICDVVGENILRQVEFVYDILSSRL